MRKGLNPNKNKNSEPSVFLHQVVIPVYIPELTAYFSDSLEILEMCLSSLFKTSHELTFISVINNGSCKEVKEFLEDLFQENKIHELVHTENIGKINAVLKGLVGHNIPLVTISDADVLFLNGWQQATVKVFETFPKAGVVGLTPQFKSYESHCGNIIFEKILSRKLKFADVENPEGLKHFYKSIGWDDTYNIDYLKKTLFIKNGKEKAVVGSGHYVATYKRQVFQQIFTYHNAKLGIDSEKSLDLIPLKLGLWRLTTSGNYAYHMGNIKESWMIKQLQELKTKERFIEYNLPQIKIRNVSSLSYVLKNRLLVKIFSSKKTKRMFYLMKGLPKEMRDKY